MGDYVSRGNIPDFDFGVNDLIADSQWHDLDISHIVPSGERLVKVVFAVQAAVNTPGLILRHPGHTNNRNNIRTGNCPPGRCIWESGDVLCNVDGKLKYYLYTGTYNTIHITIRGWWIQ